MEVCVTRTFVDHSKKKSSLLQQRLPSTGPASAFCVSRRLPSLLLLVCGVVFLFYLEEQQLPVECRDNSRKKSTNKQAEEKNKMKEEDDETEEEEGEEETSKDSDEEEEARGKGPGKRVEEKEDGHSKKKFSFCSNGLRDAVNAAILELAGEHYVANVLLTQYPSLSYVPILTCPTPVLPERSKSAVDEKRDGGRSGGMGGGERGRSSLGKDESTRENVTEGGGASSADGRSIDTASTGTSAELPNASPDHVDTLWPTLDDIQPADLLHDVLNSGKLRVAGLGPEPPGSHDFFAQWYGNSWRLARRRWRTLPPGGRPPPSAAKLAAKAAAGTIASNGRSFGGTWEQADGTKDPTETQSVFLTQTNTGFNWGEEGDYTLSEPAGYFPSYLRAIAERVSEHYGRPIEVVWSFFSSGKDCFRSVQHGHTHMTDIYFLAAYQKNSSSMWEHFSHTCPVSGSPNLFVTLKEYNIHSLQDLVRHIRMTANPRLRTIAYLSAGNYETIQHFFPAHTLAEVITREEAEHRIASKQVLGNIRTGSARNIPPEFTVVDLGLVLAQVPYFSRTDVPHCLYHQLLVREAARSSRRDIGKDGDTGAARSKKKQRSSAAPGAAWDHIKPSEAAAAVAASLLLGFTAAA